MSYNVLFNAWYSQVLSYTPFHFFFTFPLRIKDWYSFTLFWEKDRRSVFFLQQILLILLKILAPATIFHSKITSLSTFSESSSKHPPPFISPSPLPPSDSSSTSILHSKIKRNILHCTLYCLKTKILCAFSRFWTFCRNTQNMP